MNNEARFIKTAFFAAAFIIALFSCGTLTLRSSEPEFPGAEEIMSELDFNGMDGIIDKTGGMPDGLSFSETALKAVKGELDLSLPGILRSLGQALFREVSSFSKLMRELLAVALLSAILGALSGGLRTKSVSELGFYVCYIISVTIILSSFVECIGVLREFAGTLCRLIEAAAPLMTGTLLMSGNPSSAAVFNPMALFAAAGIEFVIRDLATPMLIFSATLRVVGNISGGDMLSRLAELIKKCVSVGLKVLAGLFVGVLTLQRAGAPIMNGAVVRSARYAIGAVPVVGQALTGAVDAVLYWSGAVKSGVMIAVILAVFFMCLPAVLKLTAFAVIYKLTAALSQPVSDARALNALDGAGSLAAVALGAAALSASSFIIMLMITISV